MVWLVVLSGTAQAAEESYAVKRGDTIYSIARQLGIPPSELADRNGLSRSSHVNAGQRLIIPAESKVQAPVSPTRAAAHVSLPYSIKRAIALAPVRAGRWQYIVVHHSGVDTGTMKGMDHYHRDVRHIGFDAAHIGLHGGHLASEAQNKIALGICLVGNFDEHPPTRKEMESLRALVVALMARCDLTPRAVKTHQQINIVHTRCPGTKFPTQAFLDSLPSLHH